MVAIWFTDLMTDWTLRRQPELKDVPFALAMLERNRRLVKAVNEPARQKGAFAGMVVADCKALVPDLQVLDYLPEQPQKLLMALAEWCIRFTPCVAIDADGLLLDASGCAHLWGGEEKYLKDIYHRIAGFGYRIRVAMADTIGAAWAVSRYGKESMLVKTGSQVTALRPLPPASLRLDPTALERLDKLGLRSIGSFMDMPRTALRRRFGQEILSRLDQALGAEMEIMEPIRPMMPFQERLPSLEPIRTPEGIAIALHTLLEQLCQRLGRESKGLRQCTLRCYRIDGQIQSIAIGTNRPTRHIRHLFKLLEIKIVELEPDLGIELFVLEAVIVEDLLDSQDALWVQSSASEAAVAELLDRLGGKTSSNATFRYLAEEHYWPERSISNSLTGRALTEWRSDLPRPTHLFSTPEPIEVTVPMPDYPPLLFKYKQALHTVKKADGPERIEQEWWLQTGQYRDYYCVENEKGERFWLFRSGDYNSNTVAWFIHGLFA